MNRKVLIGLVALLAANSLLLAEQPAYRPGAVLVRFANEPNVTAKSAILNSALGKGGASIKREYTLVKGLTHVSLPAGMSVESAVASLKKSSSVLYAEPDYRIEMLAVPNDTRFGDLWAMRNTGQSGGIPGADINATGAWDINTGSSNIIVAVTDTGVDYTHPDLAANMWTDANGHFGYDFGDDDSNPMDDSPGGGHGTHVAGTIGAVGNNSRGVVGVCWHVRIMAIKLSDANSANPSSWASNAVAGIQYSVANGARVINASWRVDSYSQNLYDAIAAARDAGVIFVAAAGNDNSNNDSTPVYPASYGLDNIISVMATTDTDAQAPYANYGLTSVDLGAPGGAGNGDKRDILSTYSGGGYGYVNMAGSSMASPHVSGACALLLSIDPTLSYSEVKQILLNTVDPTLPGLCVSGGRLNLAAAAQEAAMDTTPPTPSTAVWDIQPQATGLHTVTMRAVTATDRSGVEYYFECVNDVNRNSGWEPNTLYSFTTLGPGTTYGFHFKVRDKSAQHNQTDWSTTVFAKTGIGAIDPCSPAPNPPRWAIKPQMIAPTRPGQYPKVNMQAETAYDESGVQYWFEVTATPGTSWNSGWQDSSSCTVTYPAILFADGNTYTFRLKVRDKSAAHNQSSWSLSASTRTQSGPQILKVPADYSYIQLAVDIAHDGDIVEISPYPTPPYTYRPLVSPNGTYGGNCNIHFNGKAITVRSVDPTNPDIVASTVIDCQGRPDPCDQRRAFIFDGGEGPNSVLAGLTIRNAYVKGTDGDDGRPGTRGDVNALDGNDGKPGGNAYGGAILCTRTTPGLLAASPKILNCVIENCVADGGNGGRGGNGADGNNYTPEVNNAGIIIPASPATAGGNGGNGGINGYARGGGIYCDYSCSPLIEACIIRGCTVLPGTPGNGGNGGNGGNDPNTGQEAGGDAGNGSNAGDNIFGVADVRGGGIATLQNGTKIIGCTIEDCNAFNSAQPGQPGVPGAGVPVGRNGSAHYPGYAMGGGVYDEYPTNAIISSTNFLRNQTGASGAVFQYLAFGITSGNGGGFYGVVSGNSITMTDCNFIQNAADVNFGYGGGICLRGNGNLILRNCNIANNNAGFDGGGVFDYGVATGIYDSNVTGNTAPYGGGMLLAELVPTVQDSNFLNNTAQEGGAAFMYDCIHVNISSSQITGNSAVMPQRSGLEGGLGGGLACWQSYGAIANCLMNSNSAGDEGGAAFVEGYNDYPLQFINCLIKDNTAIYDGGGLSDKTWAWTELINCTLVNNSATDGAKGSGGGVSCAEDWAWVEIYNSILWDNSAAYGPQIGVGSRFGSFGNLNANVEIYYSDVQGGADDEFVEDPVDDLTAVWWWAGNFDADPLFTNIAVSQPAYYLSQLAAGQLEDSPCLNAGDPAITVSNLESMVGGGVKLTTRTDLVEDACTIDVGYHYKAGSAGSAGSAGKYPLTIAVYQYDPIEGGHGRLNAKTTPQNDTQFDINDPNTIQVNPATVVNLTALPDPCYKVQSWSGTDNDSSTALTNTVTMNSGRNVIVTFAPDHKYYLTVTVIGNGTVTPPAGRTLRAAGEVVTFTATPANFGDVVIWTGTDNDNLDGQTNTVTMTGNRNVTVKFYTARILHVGGDVGYPTIQSAIDDANDRDIVILMPSSQPYYTQNGFTIIGRNITIASSNPDDPTVVASTIIQQQVGPEGDVSPAFLFQNVGPLMRLWGITIRGFSVRGLNGFDGLQQGNPSYDGQPGDSGAGMAIFCELNASPTVKNCVIEDCHSEGGNGGNGAAGVGSDTNTTEIHGGNGGWPGGAYGGAVLCEINSNPAFINCTFSGNSATGGNGGNGGNGNGTPVGQGGRGGGWYYGYNIPRPWYWGLSLGEEPRFYSGLGGAVCIFPSCTVTFESCTFINNTSSGGLNGICGEDGLNHLRDEPTTAYRIDNLGGAVYLLPYGAADFNNCTFTANTADTNKTPASFDGFLGYGGAVAADFGATATFNNCGFGNNRSDIGGGVYSLLSYAEVNNCDFADNNATHGGGLLFADSVAYITGSTFSGNFGTLSGSDGGAIGLLGTNAEVADCNITNNRVGGNGGGIYISSKNVDGSEIAGDNSVLVKNCLITGNVADLGGGGIAAAWYSDVNIVNCTIANNSSIISGTDTGFGGGVYCSYNSYVNILNSIIWGNFGTAGAQLSIGTGLPSTVDVSYSDIGPSADNNDVNKVTIEPAAALTINATNDANVLASTILGPGISVVGQPQYIGAARASGTFAGGLAAGIGIESGIILTSGDANFALPPNNSDGRTFDNNTPGDPDLTALLQAADPTATNLTTNDAAILEFTFTTKGGNLFFNFVFASEEYNEFVNSSYNDVFGFFLDGVNLALIPGTTRPVSINNVNGGNPFGTDASNPQLYHNNDPCQAGGAPFAIQYDGFTSVFTARAFNVGSGTHTIKLAIADTADHALDSAVFIQAGSFSDKPSYSTPIYVGEGCTLIGWDSNAPDPNKWDPNFAVYGNKNEDPLFIGGYFLNQIAAGQLINSPCWDAGSADVNSPDINLSGYTTRTDGVPDVCTVDMGYHYPLFLFTPQKYSLTIEVNGVGGHLFALGRGDSNFTIEAPNSRLVNPNTVVSLRALADAGYGVSRWTGTDNDASTDPNNTVTMDSDKVVKVDFFQYKLTIEVMGPNGVDPNGSLVATATGTDPFTISARPGPISRVVAPGSVVNLEAFPDVNFKVRVWTGTDNDASTARTNTVTMNSNKTVRVGFEPNGLYYLTVTVIGNGTITPAPGRYLRHPGDVVTLVATPTNPSDAIIWTGTDDDYLTVHQNTVTMNGHRDVTVEFYTPRILYVGTDTSYPTIQFAIDAANNRDIVMITPGTYNIYESSKDRPYLYISGKDIRLTSTNPVDANATQIIGGFVIDNATRRLIIEGLTIRDAIYWKDYEQGIDSFTPVSWGTPQGAGADGYGGGTCRGAGMQLNGTASPTVRNCQFINCVARGMDGATGAGGSGADGWGGNGGPGGKAFGGGAYCGQGGSPLFEDCSFINCSAQAGDAGNGGSAAPATGGHGGAWGDVNGVWWDEWRQLWGAVHPLEEYWKYSGYGGAIYCDVNSTAEFVNCTFTGNSTLGSSCGISGASVPSGWPTQHYKIESFGGAVYAASGSAPQFAECNFINNEANMQGPPTSRKDNVATVNAYPNISFGGAVAFEDGAAPVFENCTFNSNRATVGGGAFSAWAYGTVTDCNFEDNSSYNGGGILCVGGTSEIVNSRFTGNQSTVLAAQGGAITLLGANAEVRDCNIWNNTTAGSGGGVYISSQDVDGNELPNGDSVLIKNCLITGNVAAQDGGGISANWYSDVNIVNCTIFGNRVSGLGGGLFSSYSSYVDVINSIIWDNQAGIGSSGSQIAVGGGELPSAIRMRYSDVQDSNDPCAWTNDINAVDFVICFDTTGSMGGDIDAVKTTARQITNAIAAQYASYRLALVDFRDYPDGNYGSPGDWPYRDRVKFTTNANELIAGLQPMAAGGGADGPEAIYTALMHCIDANALAARLTDNGHTNYIDSNSPGPGDWRQGKKVMRVILLLTDAPPHDPENYTNYVLNDIITAANGRNPIHIIPVVIRPIGYAEGALSPIAAGTGGILVTAADSNAVTGAVLNAIGLLAQVPTPIFIEPGGTINWNPTTFAWELNSHNINADPLFIGGFFLSQIDAGQISNSPCVNAGSANVNSPDINLGGYTTRTDSVNDVNIVDMGYHYPAFTPPQYHLTIIAGDGLTSADITPGNGDYVWFSIVQLHVTAPIPPGDQVIWTGTDDDSNSSSFNSVRMTGNRTVNVALVKNTCNLTVISSNGGTVTPTSGIYPRGANVNLTATPDAGYRIQSWEGTDNDGLFTRTNTVTMNGDKTVRVTFSLPQTVTVPINFTTIQEAIDGTRSGDMITVESGVYHVTSNNGLVINKDITITSTNPDDPCVVAATIIDLSYGEHRVHFGAGAGPGTILDGFTLTSGSYSAQGRPDGAIGQNGLDGFGLAGGVVVVESGARPTIRNCVIRDTTITGGNAGKGGNSDAANNAGRGGWAGWARGGGIYIAPFANPTLINCAITNCTVVGGNGGNGGDYTAGGGNAGYGGNWSDGTLWRTWGYENDYRWYSGYGGGVFCDANSEANFIDCNISNNTARGGMSGTGGAGPAGPIDPCAPYRIPSYGGGIYCGANSDINFVGCVISGNVAPRPDATYHTDPYLGHGGGIAFEDIASIRLQNCTISDNSSAVGGGMFWSGGQPEVLDSEIMRNTAYIGGGIYVMESAGQIGGCTLHNNFAGVSAGDVDVIAGQGGGIFGSSIDTAIADCFLADNYSSTSGGGIHIYGAANSDTIIKNCLLVNNTAGRDGGGISTNWEAAVSVENCTLYNNHATGTFGELGSTGFGGGLYCSYDASTEIKNSIFWDNNGLLGNEIAEATGFEHEQRCGTISVSYSDIRGGQAGVYISPGCPSSNWGLGNINIDPCFINAGGRDFHLEQITAGQMLNSPCIDAGGDLAVSLGMFKYSTSTLGTSDTGIVDLGYHYPISEYCRRWDLYVDNLIDFRDFAVFASAWVGDLRNTGYGTDDLKEFTYCWLEQLAGDTTAPIPNPMTWALLPHAITGNSVEMRASTAVDSSGQVYYQFEQVGGPVSAWQTGTYYVFTGLNPTGEYCFMVRARDKYNNITAWSEPVCVNHIGDVNAPTPAPVFVAVAPQNITRNDANTASGQFEWDPSNLQDDWWHRVIVDVTNVADDITPKSELEVRFICSKDRYSSDTVIPAMYRPIRIGHPVAIGGRIPANGGTDAAYGSYRLTWNGTNQIVYEVYVEAWGGSYGRQLSWYVCVYDESGNPACTGTHTIPP